MPPGKHNQPHNPYASAAGTYGTHSQKHTNDPREVEARVLLKSAQFMTDLQKEWDNRPKEALEDILKYNRNIWMMFYDTAIENTEGNRPDDLRNNIYNLANFVFKRELDILAKPEAKKLDILIKINRDIANGLMTSIKNVPAPQENSAAPESADAKKPPSGGWESSA
jgi:flagellar protein FlaF